MARAGQRDRGKERFWRKILRLWRQSRATSSVRDFCTANGVSEPSFYFWRRHLTEADQLRKQSAARRAATALPLFVPVSPAPASPAGSPAALEVVLASGQVVRVPAGFDGATLRQLLAVLAEAPPC